MNRLINGVGFQAAWLACVVGAGKGHLWLGPAASLLFLGQHLWRHPAPLPEARLMVLAGAVGLALDSALSACGVFTFLTNQPGVWISPPWMVSLWMNFAATLRCSMGWLRGRPLLAAVFGAAGGPLSYWAGAGLGAIELAGWQSLAALAVVWGVVTPWLVGRAGSSGATMQPEEIHRNGSV